MTSNLLAALKNHQGKGVTVTTHPLIEAAKNGSVDACQRALTDGRSHVVVAFEKLTGAEPKVKVDQKDSEGTCALMYAAEAGHMHVVKFLVEKGARVSAKDDTGETALMKACKSGHVDVIRFLIDAQLLQRKKSSSIMGSDSAKLLQIEKQRVLDVKDDEGVTALMKAAESDELEPSQRFEILRLKRAFSGSSSQEIARQLIEEGASLDSWIRRG
eukprot:s3714_g2.t1